MFNWEICLVLTTELSFFPYYLIVQITSQSVSVTYLWVSQCTLPDSMPGSTV